MSIETSNYPRMPPIIITNNVRKQFKEKGREEKKKDLSILNKIFNKCM